MPGLSPRLPLVKDPDDGYGLTKNLKQVAAQNFKMLVLTIPGERIMDPGFGVGILSYLFENNSPHTYDEIRAKIEEQTAKYLPYIEIQDISFGAASVVEADPSDSLVVRIQYFLKPLSTTEILELPISN
jgi:phage baseplate assembly protein W